MSSLRHRHERIILLQADPHTYYASYPAGHKRDNNLADNLYCQELRIKREEVYEAAQLLETRKAHYCGSQYADVLYLPLDYLISAYHHSLL